LGCNGKRYESYRAESQGNHLDSEKALQNYYFHGHFILSSLKGSEQLSYDAREEVRITVRLLYALQAEYRSRDRPNVARGGQNSPLYVYPTVTINRFASTLFKSYATMYESVLLSKHIGHLDEDEEKTLLTWGQLLQNCTGSANMQRNWGSRNNFLLMQKSMKEWGFAWTPVSLINWPVGTIQPSIISRFPNMNVVLKEHFPGQETKQLMIQDFLADIKAVIDACLTLSFTDGDQWVDLTLFCHWLAMQILRRYYQEVWTETYKSKYTWKGKREYIRDLGREHTEDEIKKRFVVGRHGKGVPLHARC
jgi:hypothetical protein